MIPARKSIPVLVLSMVLLLAAAPGSALPGTSQGRWSGTVAAIAGDDLSLTGVAERFRLAGSVTELLSGRAVSAGDIAPGSAVTLRLGPREADGRFRVDALVVQPKNPLWLEGEVSDVASDGRSFSVHGVRVEIGAQTAFSGRGAAGFVRGSRDITAGMTVRVTLSASAAGTLQAKHVRAVLTRNRTARVVSGRGSGHDSAEDQEIKGTIEAITDSAWTIDGRSFLVNDQTLFQGDPGVGDFVEVKFHVDGDSQAVADRIQKEDDAEENDDEAEFRGIVEAVGDTAWTISGQIVLVNASTVFRGSPGVGDLVEVRADRAADGTLTATDIHLEDENGDDNGDDNGGQGNDDGGGNDDHGGHGNDDGGGDDNGGGGN